MGHKIFISYKYWDTNVYPLGWEPSYKVRNYVSKLEKYFGLTEDVYKGEHDDEDLSELDGETIWSKLKDRIFDSTVTIVIISPGMRDTSKRDKNQWIPWEISYSLKEMERNDRTSHSNALLAVVLPDKNGRYNYFIEDCSCWNAGSYRLLKTNQLFNILHDNMFNHKHPTCKYFASINSTLYYGEPSYIVSVKWKDFCESPQLYIERAVRIKENIDAYEITKELKDE